MGETLIEATRREVREETGVEAEIGRLLIVCDAIEPAGRHLVNLVFAATVAVVPPPAGAGVLTATGAGVDPALDPAIDEVRWVSRDELLDLELHPPIARRRRRRLGRRVRRRGPGPRQRLDGGPEPLRRRCRAFRQVAKA